MKDRMIEHIIPLLAEINNEAAKEKLGTAKPPIFEITYWRTRKPLISCRALILASLLPKDFDTEKFRDLLGLKRVKRAHHYDPSQSSYFKELIEVVQHDWDKNLVILDPFAGGGSIPLETARCGVKAIAVEYNPIAWLLLKVLEWSKRYGDKLINTKLFENIRRKYRRGFSIDTEELCKKSEEELKKYGDLIYWGCKLLNELKNRLSKFYPDYNGKHVIAYIWVRQVKCPKCGAQIPLTRDWYLSEKKKIYFEPVYENTNYRVEIKKGEVTNPTTVVKGEGEALCPKCKYRISGEYLRRNIKGNDRLIVLVLEGKNYVVAREIDVQAVNDARAILEQDNVLKEFIPTENMLPYTTATNFVSRALWVELYGYEKFYELFNPRQLLVLACIAKSLKELYNELLVITSDKEYVNAIIAILSLLLSKHADYNSTLTSWHSSYEVVTHTLAFNLALTWNYVEVNPFAKGSGTLWSNFADLLEGVAYAIEKLKNSAEIEVIFGSALHLPWPDKSFKLIITDPPYYDDVPYAELSDFFYVWLKKVLGDIFPEQFGFYTLWRDRSSEELSVGGYRDEKYFELNLINAFKEIRRVLRDDGMLVLFFAHSSIEAWKRVLKMLIEAGFRVIATHAIRTESPESVIARGKLSFESSIAIACRPRLETKKIYIEEIFPELEEEVRKAVEEAWRAGYRGADLLLAAFGAMLRITTAYGELKSRSGEPIESLVNYVYGLVPRIVAELTLKKPIMAVDPYTALYVYIKTNPDYYSSKSKKFRVPGDEFKKICRSFGTSEIELSRRKLVKETRVGTRKGFELLDYRDRSIQLVQQIDSIIDALHLLLKKFEEGGRSAVETTLSEITFRGFSTDDVCEVAHSLIMNMPSNIEDDEMKIMREFVVSVCRRSLSIDSASTVSLDRWFSAKK